MKGNKGITLIALIVTIIVLIILAGVAIAMLSGQNGVINRASQARYDTAIASFDEQVRLAQMSLRTEITANMVGNNGYIATKDVKEGTETADPGYFTALVDSVKKDLGVTSASKKDEDFYVYSYLDNGTSSKDGTGYILITYSNNALRSSLPNDAGKNETFTSNAVTFTKKSKNETYSVNQAVLAYVIKVSNYNCELSEPILTDSTTIATDTAAAQTNDSTTPTEGSATTFAGASSTTIIGKYIGGTGKLPLN